ncbi:MAG: hypothetical protein ACFBZ8_01995 [Opitutales bacterium]
MAATRRTPESVRFDLLISEREVPAAQADFWSALEAATVYIAGYGWCPPIRERYLGHLEAGKLALFLFAFETPVGDADEYLWVVVGDLPPAHFVTQAAPTPARAMDAYCTLMEDWVEAVRSGRGLESCFPIDTDPTPRQADLLLRRMDYIREEILQHVAGAEPPK